MKSILRRIILSQGVIIAILAMINTFAQADPIRTNTIGFELEEQTEILALDILEELNLDQPELRQYKVYNTDDRLIYETDNIEDKKFIQLIKSSDYITEINDTFYYKLSR